MRYLGLAVLAGAGLFIGERAEAGRDAWFKLDPDAIASARVDRGDKISPDDLIEKSPGVFATKPGARKEREAKKCDLDRSQIGPRRRRSIMRGLRR